MDTNEEVIQSTDNTYIISEFKVSLEEELKKVKKQLELSNNNCNQLSAELNRLKQQTESTITLTESSTASMIESSTTSSLINGQTPQNDSTNDTLDNTIDNTTSEEECSAINRKCDLNCRTQCSTATATTTAAVGADK